MIEYFLFREIECGELCAVFSSENSARIARVASDYLKNGIDLKLQVKIDGRYATSDELREHEILIEERIWDLSDKVQ